MTVYTTGYDLAAAIDPESYHLTYDAADVAYAFRMNAEAEGHLAECVKASAPSHRAIEAFGAEPNHLRLQVDPARSPHPDSLSEWDDVLRAGVELYNTRYATAGLDELQVGSTFAGFYHLDGTPTAAEFVAEHTGRPPDEHDPVWGWVNDADPPEQFGRRLTWRVVILTDRSTFETPEVAGYDVPEPPGFEWDLDALELTVSDRVDWPANRQELQRVVVHDEWIQADIDSGAMGSPQGFAKSVRKALRRYNQHRDGRVDVPGGSVSRPPLKLRESPHYVGPIDTAAVDEWVAALPELSGEPIDPTPEPEPDPEPSGGRGGLAGLNPFGGSP